VPRNDEYSESTIIGYLGAALIACGSVGILLLILYVALYYVGEESEQVMILDYELRIMNDTLENNAAV